MVPAQDGNRLIVVLGGSVYEVDADAGTWRPTLALRQCRNVLHQSIARRGSTLVFGEYGANPERESVPVHCSRDDGRTWQPVFEFEPGSARHVHGVFWDPHTSTWWVSTGDFNGECHLQRLSETFEPLQRIGDGSQLYRTCFLWFTPTHVYWTMDSQLETTFAVRLDRSTGVVERLQAMPGPVWYAKALTDGVFLAATACESGPSVRGPFAHLYASGDAQTWHEVARFPHDGLPRRWFKAGVLGFADGEQSSTDFWMFGEALRGIEGQAWRCTLAQAPSPAHDPGLSASSRGLGLAQSAIVEASWPGSIADLEGQKPSFRRATIPGLVALTTSSDAVRRPWARALMRFIAVRKDQIRPRFMTRWPSQADREAAALVISVVLLQTSIRERDPRYLNAVYSLDAAKVLPRVRWSDRLGPALSLAPATRLAGHVRAVIASLEAETSEGTWR
ncbi:MAG: hypothetical protein KC912_15085 [Proteobacteria bacterium]|nr:hypothetical protein [Pseudomonadota bacterium]